MTHRHFDPFRPDQQTEYVASPKWVRVYFGGHCIADSKNVVLLRESGQLPVYYFPPEDVARDLLHPAPKEESDSARAWQTVQVDGKTASRAAWTRPDLDRIADYVAFDWNAMEAWFEEDEQVHVHPRDPYKRLDTLASSRSVRVVIDGQTIASSERPTLLFETGLPVRYYLPKVDTRMDRLEPSDKQSRCPYKGTASYYSIRTDEGLRENLVWYYPFPNPNLSAIQGLVCFFHEKIDEFYVDGERLSETDTPWS